MLNITKNRGITLVALVITIIVMLILAGVTISVIVNGGLFDKAKESAELTNKKALEEDLELLRAELEISKYINDSLSMGEEETLRTALEEKGYTIELTENQLGYKISKNRNILHYTDKKFYVVEGLAKEVVIGTVNLGDRILYDSNTGYENTTNGWKILYIENGKIAIISTTTTESVRLGGKVVGDYASTIGGYNDSISTLNKFAQKYIEPTYAESARCVGSDRNNLDGTSDLYINSQDFAGKNYQYVLKYASDMKTFDDKYAMDYNNMKAIGVESTGGAYWLASRNVTATPSLASFNGRIVTSSGLTGNYTLWSANGDTNMAGGINYSCGFRPIVILKSSVIVTDGNGLDGWSIQ